MNYVEAVKTVFNMYIVTPAYYTLDWTYRVNSEKV